MVKLKTIKKKDFIFISLFIILYVFLFFIYKNKLIFTPDFGESDAFHFNISVKHFLGDTLRQLRFPFWTDKLQGGFPLFSEGQIGSLYLPNIIFLTLFPFHIGYNLLFVFVFFTLSMGMYLLLKELKLSQIIAFLISLSFSIYGVFTLQMVHINLIQTFSTVPLLFFLYLRFLSTMQKRHIVFFCFVSCQTIFAGYMQISFLVFFGLLLWFTLLFFITFRKFFIVVKHSIILLIFIAVSFLIALPQILPTFMLTDFASRTIQLSYESLTAFPLQFKNLISFFSPYSFGNPKLGTYPPFSSQWGIFWENTPYVGRILFLLFIISCIGAFFIKNKKYKRFFILNFSLFILFILLALGKNSPLYFVFNFPPFSFFRVPSRYLMMAVFFMSLIVAFFADFLYRKSNKIIQVILIIILLVNVIDLIFFVYQYHLFVNKDMILYEPKLAKKIDEKFAYITLDQPTEWNKVFLKKGWNDTEAVNSYIFFKNYLYPNSNLLYGKKIYDINTPLLLRRQDYFHSLLINSVKRYDREVTNTVHITQLFRLLGVKYVIASSQLKNKDFQQIDSVSQYGITIRLYAIKDIKDNKWYIPQKLIPITYLKDFENQYEGIKNLEKESFVEGKKSSLMNKNNNIRITSQKMTDISVNLKGNFDNQTFLVFKKNWYPEWHAYVDKKETPIYKTNLVHIGIDIPKGTHTVELVYENRMFKYGVYISLATLIIFLFALKKIDLKFLKRLRD